MAVKKIVAVWLLIITVAAVGISIGRLSVSGVSAAAGEGYEELKTFTEVMSMVKKHYVEEVKTKDLIYGAIRGMLSSLDPHSSFMPPDAFKDMQAETKGEFGGLGIQVGIKDKSLTVIAPIEDTPASRAGIKAGDKIVSINKESTKDMSMEDAVSKMRGAPKTSVTIGIMREGSAEEIDFTLTREIIKIKSVKSKMLEGKIAYVKVTQFQEQTAADLATALDKLNAEKFTAIILDLRNNPGGLLNSSIDVSGQFLPKGKLVVYIKSRNGEKAEFLTEGDKPYVQPMVVLVNQGSASASEIVAGALKDWNRAVILGTQTFGKGSVQTVIPLSDGAGVRLTTAKYYTAKGTSIQNTGITPDIVLKLASKNGAKEHPVLREKDLARHLKNEQTDTNPDEDETAPLEVDEKDDIQLQRALDILKTWNIFKGLPRAS